MLTGAANFRDLGGILTVDGRRIRSGMIYRSNSFSRLTEEDIAVVERLGLKTIIDLRTYAERSRSPSRWINDLVNVVSSGKLDTEMMLAPIFEAGDGDEVEWRRRFSEFFAQIPDLYADEFAAMFGALAEGKTPLLVNCSAGKDRTGVAALLILLAVGVDREVAIADYLLSEERLQNDPAFVEMLSATVHDGFSRLPPYARAVMLGTHRQHADAVIGTIGANYGSVEGYLIRRLGFSSEALLLMRERLTEAVS
ncbi:MAG TPA: tyrosine-protein phosphatase [Beijerinckia sp.]|jgi:protein-tyrosine phosphatase|nr:tyrosine-protein phosphatase [Beijerinckia sp.]